MRTVADEHGISSEAVVGLAEKARWHLRARGCDFKSRRCGSSRCAVAADRQSGRGLKTSRFTGSWISAWRRPATGFLFVAEGLCWESPPVRRDRDEAGRAEASRLGL